MLETRDEIIDRLFKKDIVFPKRVVSVDEQSVACHAGMPETEFCASGKDKRSDFSTTRDAN
jgi:hypothetical protein